MRDSEIASLDELESTYWWHVGRRRIVDRLVRVFAPSPRPARILDIGCGTGRNLDVLERFGPALGLDSSAEAVAAARRLGHRGRLMRGAAERLPFRDAAFDLVTALDVFEHLENDVAGFGEVRRVLRPGGYLLAAVPAFRFLWSEHDEALGHRRRYVASEFHQKLNLAGFHMIKRTYAITFVFPLILAFRLWRGLFPKVGEESASYVILPAWMNDVFASLLALEGRLMRFVSLPIGTSVFVVAQRPRR